MVECALLGPLLGDSQPATLSTIVRSIASGRVRKYLERHFPRGSSPAVLHTPPPPPPPPHSNPRLLLTSCAQCSPNALTACSIWRSDREGAVSARVQPWYTSGKRVCERFSVHACPARSMPIVQSVVVAVSSWVALARTIKKRSPYEHVKFRDFSQGGPAAGNDRPASCGSGDLAAGDGSVPAAPTSAPERDAQARAQRTARMCLRHTAATPRAHDMAGLASLHLPPPPC